VPSVEQLSKSKKNERRIGESSLQKIIDSDAFYTTQKTSKAGIFFTFTITAIISKAFY